MTGVAEKTRAAAGETNIMIIISYVNLDTPPYSRYSCFVCDFDLCLGCKNVWEARSQARRAGAARRLRRHPRLARAEVPVPSVVCLKTLCDTVAKIEEAKKLKVRLL